MRIQTIVLAAAAAASLLPGRVSAQTAPPAQGAAAATQAAPAKPAGLGNWWEKSSLSYSPVPEPWLVHITSNLSFTDARGNTHGTQFGWQTDLVFRKKRFTDRVLVDLRDADMTYGLGGGLTDYQERTLRNHAEYDLTKEALLVAGVEHIHNTLYFIDSRNTVYGGAGWTLLDQGPHKIDVIGGIGVSSFVFQKDEMAHINPVAVAAFKTTTPTSGAGLLMEGWNWKFSDNIALRQDMSYLGYFDRDLGELVTFNVSIDIPVRKHLSVGPRYSLKYETNIYMDALGVEPLDKTLTLGVKFSF